MECLHIHWFIHTGEAFLLVWGGPEFAITGPEGTWELK
jgi:hypothetical protein